MAKQRSDRSDRFTNKASATGQSKTTRTVLLGGIVAALVAIFLAYPTLLEKSKSFLSTKSRSALDEEIQQPIFSDKPLRIQSKKKEPLKETNTITVTNVYSMTEQEEYQVLNHRWLSLASEATELRERPEPCVASFAHRKQLFPPRDVMELVDDVQRTVLSLYDMEKYMRYTPVAIRNSKKHANQVVLFALYSANNKRNKDTIVFDNGKLKTTEEKQMCDNISAKLATVGKAHSMSLTLAYMLALLSTVGHQFTSGGEFINATAFSTGFVAIKDYEHLLFVEGNTMDDLNQVVHQFDTREGFIGVLDDPAAPKIVRARSINPLADKRDQIEMRKGTPYIPHAWVTLALNNSNWGELVIEIDPTSAQYDIKKGLPALVTKNLLERTTFGYHWKNMYVPEESILKLGARYISRIKEGKKVIGDSMFSAEEAEVFATAVALLFKKWDPEFANSKQN
jgi:hypothetical protein